jgi:hypothetical protein
MNTFTFSVRSQGANTRIVAAAKQIAPRYGATTQVAALEAVKDKDPQTEQVKRLEAVADLLERIVANAPMVQTKPEPRMDIPLPKLDPSTFSRTGGKGSR